MPQSSSQSAPSTPQGAFGAAAAPTPQDVPATLTPGPVLASKQPSADGTHTFDFRNGQTESKDEPQEFTMKIR
jgi:hypothetical protein